MADRLEGRALEIFEEGRNYAHVAIPRSDGTVQTVMAWTHTDHEGNVTLNSNEWSQWPRTLRRAGTATVTVLADGNPYEWVSVTGRLVGDTHEGADDHIDELGRKYTGEFPYPYRRPGEQRVKLTLAPERVHYNPPS
jgi:hypothetical protein